MAYVFVKCVFHRSWLLLDVQHHRWLKFCMQTSLKTEIYCALFYWFIFIAALVLHIHRWGPSLITRVFVCYRTCWSCWRSEWSLGSLTDRFISSARSRSLSTWMRFALSSVCLRTSQIPNSPTRGTKASRYTHNTRLVLCSQTSHTHNHCFLPRSLVFLEIMWREVRRGDFEETL